ncbi:MAG: hypothetical protein Kow0047_24310 [Anaerolineae bacterium]
MTIRHALHLAVLILFSLSVAPVGVWASTDAPGAAPYHAFLPAVLRPPSSSPAPAEAPSVLLTPEPVENAGYGWEITGPIDYVMQPGETLNSIAIEFGRDLSDLACATRRASEDPSVIEPGYMLSIPALGTVCHIVRRGETIESLASLYGVPPAVIIDNAWNEIEGPPYEIHPGQRLRITGALDPRFMVPPTPRPIEEIKLADNGLPLEEWPYGDGQFIWPVHGHITQPFSAEHRAIDIATEFGATVVAADTGTVIKAGWNDQGLGYRVVIDHHIDYVTVYAHLSAVLVHEGEVVKKGQPIGVVGSSGNSTGPHLHFAIRDYGIAVDPLALLPPQ